MLLAVGLGNPGGGHAKNRHNIGFMALDAIVEHHRFQRYRAKFSGSVAEGRIAGRRIAALKPLVYMNDSGRSVAEAARFFRVPPDHIIVLHDEIDLAPGRLRVKRGGGHAGHNGLRNIHAHIGPDYCRVRLGVGHPGHKHRVAGHVLRNFVKADQAWVNGILDAVAEHFALLVEGDDSTFMSKVAHDMQAVLPKRAPSKGNEDGPPKREGDDGI
ncbi:MAG: aminoacyl-tRNA hydrolase [Rhodospirillales bacterium]|nr:aminoacyl-tRNA hydrolase [Rhodospirillales bacterium]MDP6804911.1 aminoacyl-tRNA hydrolase [Rhodospirillales bacterium]